jgi:signal transduction histidine kinase/DNA-binding NarL/FixJ family response regulator
LLSRKSAAGAFGSSRRALISRVGISGWSIRDRKASVAEMSTKSRRRSTKLATKLQAILAVVAASVALVAWVGYVRTLSIEQRVAALYDGRVIPLRELKALSDLHAIDVVDAVHKVVFGRFTAKEGEARLATALREIDEAWLRYNQMQVNPDELRRVRETTPLLQRARKAVEEAREDMARGDLAALDEFRRVRMYQEIDPLTARLNELVDVEVHNTDALVRVARADLQTSRNAGSAALMATGFLALSVGFVFSRRLASSLLAMKAVVRTAATGNLSARVALAGADELAEMAADIDAMIESLDRSRRDVEAHALALVASETKARAANEAKSVFLSSMSHELRTPLNVILGYAQMLLRVRERAFEDRRELEHIVEAGRHLLGLIDDVLSISKVEVGKLSLRPLPFSPAALVQVVADMLSARAQAKGLAFDVACDPKAPRNVLGDEGKLRQVLVNLIENAIKFTAKGRVGVGVGYDAGKLTVRITDTGPGIAAEEQARLFETFYQGAAGRASAMGTGLGLYISQTLVRLMGGEIAVESELGAGTAFSFALPAPSASPSEEVRRGYVGARIPADAAVRPMLVVDDRATNRDVLARLLRELGVEVVEVESGLEALACCEQTRFSMIWMDLRMPGMDGWSALDRIRQRDRELERPRTLVVAITASVIELDRESALCADFDDLLSKPFLDDTVFHMVESRLGIELETAAAPTSVRLTLGDALRGIDALSPDERTRLLTPLLLGDIAEALLVTDALDDPSARVSLRAIIETYQLDELIDALRRRAES